MLSKKWHLLSLSDRNCNNIFGQLDKYNYLCGNKFITLIIFYYGKI